MQCCDVFGHRRSMQHEDSVNTKKSKSGSSIEVGCTILANMLAGYYCFHTERHRQKTLIQKQARQTHIHVGISHAGRCYEVGRFFEY